jgi:two-component system chemotaxis response regulator CheY
MSGRTVLVVDDDRDIRDALFDVLSDERYTVVCAADGAEGIARLRSESPPAVILLDWMMPKCDGACFLRQQRADPAFAAIPVVLLTADGRALANAEETGVQARLAKPVSLDELLAVVARYTG